jgi:hypothetical protein
MMSGDTGNNCQKGHFKQQTFTASTPISNPGNNNVVFESGAGIGNGINVELGRKLQKNNPLHLLPYLTMLLYQTLNTSHLTVKLLCIGLKRLQQTSHCVTAIKTRLKQILHKLTERQNFIITSRIEELSL